MRLYQVATFVTVLGLPEIAHACNARGHGCGSMGYATAFGVGIAAGILSILFERSFKKRR